MNIFAYVYLLCTMKIVDCFTFFNELDLLKYRLHILNDVVDFFVIVEATHTHAGKEKTLIFEENKHLFEKYKDKIIHVVVSDFKFVAPDIDFQKNEQWKNENYQRDCIDKGIQRLKDCLSPDDVLTITDLDEIPDPRILNTIKTQNINITVNILEMDFYYYNLNSKIQEKWYHPKIISYGTYRNLGLSFNALRFHECEVIRRGGWHLSYFGDANFIQTKIKEFAHQELNNENFTNIEKIKKRMNSHSDLYDRPYNRVDKIRIQDNDYLPPDYDTFLRKFFTL